MQEKKTKGKNSYLMFIGRDTKIVLFFIILTRTTKWMSNGSGGQDIIAKMPLINYLFLQIISYYHSNEELGFQK
jgi:hypothetical protein